MLSKLKKIFILDSERFSQKLFDNNLIDEYIKNVNNWINKSDSDKVKDSNPCYFFIKKHKKNLCQGVDEEDFIRDLKYWSAWN